MQVRVADQVESERRAALAAGRRRIERELSTQLAEQQTASLERQQVGRRALIESSQWACDLKHLCEGLVQLLQYSQPCFLATGVCTSLGCLCAA